MGIHTKFLIPIVLVTALTWGISALCFAQAAPQITAADIYARAHSSVVVVIVADSNEKPIGQGSGFIVAKNRIVTNHHVVKGAADALVVFADGTSELVEGVAADSPTRDLAILVVKTGSRLPLILGDEDSVRQGDTVYALAAPRGLESSFTSGIVSGFRDLDDQFRLQTTAPIAPGSSGGPLFNSSGRVIGVTTELLTDSPSIYFSIGARDVKRLLKVPNLVSMPLSALSHENRAEAESPAQGNSGENKVNSSDGELVVAGKSQASHGTEVWRNLRDGQNYRTSSNGEVMHLESVDVYPKTAADILNCDFKRAVSVGVGWTGACRERNPKDRSTIGSTATLTIFSETQIEGFTENVPEFVMIPASAPSLQNGQLVTGGSASRGGIHIVTDVLGATAVLHGAAGRELGQCQTPCGFNELFPSQYTVEVQKQGYRSAQISLRVMTGKVWEQTVRLEVPSANLEPPHIEKSSPTPTPHKAAPVPGAEAAEYAGRIEEVISERGLTGRVEVQRIENTIVLVGKLRPTEHGVLLKFLRDAPASVRVVDHIEYEDAPSAEKGHDADGGHPVPTGGRGAIHVITDVIEATAVLRGPAGRVLNQCQTPCSFNELAPAQYSLEVQKDGYQPMQNALQVNAGSVVDQKVTLDSLAKGLLLSSRPPGRMCSLTERNSPAKHQ